MCLRSFLFVLDLGELGVSWLKGVLGAIFTNRSAWAPTCQVPILVRKLDKFRAKAMTPPKPGQPVVLRRDASVLVTWALALAALCTFLVMHSWNYAGGESSPSAVSNLYATLWVAFLLYTLTALRQYVRVPDKEWARRYAVGYDIVLTRPFFRNHVGLIVLCLLGFARNEFFSVMLLDILNLSGLLGVTPCLLF